MQLRYGTTYPRVSEGKKICCCEIRGEMAINAQMGDNAGANAVMIGVVNLSDILKIAQRACLPVVFHPMRSLLLGRNF